jgi:hypothetical protein
VRHGWAAVGWPSRRKHRPHGASFVRCSSAEGLERAGDTPSRVHGAGALGSRRPPDARELEGPESKEPVVGLTLGLSLMHQGEIARGFESLLAAAQLTKRNRDDFHPDYVVFAALGLSWIGEYGRARALLGDLLGRARDTAAFGVLWSALYGAAYLEARTGHLIRAYASAIEGVSVPEATDNNFWRYLSLCCLAYVEAAQLRDRESQEHAHRGLEIARRHGFGYPAPVLDALGLLELALGHADEAIDHLRASNVRGDTDQPTFARLSGPDLVEAHVRAGRPLPPSLVAEVHAVSEDARFPGAAAVAWRAAGASSHPRRRSAPVSPRPSACTNGWTTRSRWPARSWPTASGSAGRGGGRTRGATCVGSSGA